MTGGAPSSNFLSFPDPYSLIFDGLTPFLNGDDGRLLEKLEATLCLLALLLTLRLLKSQHLWLFYSIDYL